MNRRFTSAAGIVLAAFAAVAPVRSAVAGEIGDAFLEAEAALPGDDAIATWEAFERATELYWAAAPLSFSAIVIADEVRGFGDYDPRPDNRFSAGDRFTLYVEPVGYGWTAIGDDYRIRFVLDLAITSEARGALFSEPEFAVVERRAMTRAREFQATISLTLPALPPDRYQMQLTFRDSATGKSGLAEIDFVVE